MLSMIIPLELNQLMARYLGEDTHLALDITALWGLGTTQLY